MKSIIVIAGPTAVGKTAKAIEVAKHFNTVILSADSRQCYKELRIGVASPTAQELAIVPHYFIQSHSLSEKLTAAWYETYALNLLEKLFEKHEVVVVTGGTGLYIKALTNGLDLIPEIDENIRQTILNNYKTLGIKWLQQQLQLLDPVFATTGEMQNPHRMLRALEVVTATGQSILSFRTHQKKSRPFNVITIGLALPREQLYQRINNRVDSMLQAGLEAEVEGLLPYRNFNALQTVGYKELFNYFDGNSTRQQAIDQIKQNTRHYAKRQMTWFKKQTQLYWLNMNDNQNIVNIIHQFLSVE